MRTPALSSLESIDMPATVKEPPRTPFDGAQRIGVARRLGVPGRAAPLDKRTAKMLPRRHKKLLETGKRLADGTPAGAPSGAHCGQEDPLRARVSSG